MQKPKLKIEQISYLIFGELFKKYYFAKLFLVKYFLSLTFSYFLLNFHQCYKKLFTKNFLVYLLHEIVRFTLHNCYVSCSLDYSKS